MDNLKPYRTYVASLIIGWSLLATIVSAGIGYAVYASLGSVMLSFTAYVIFLLASIIVIGLAVVKPATEATEYLARAILHVSSESSGMPAPNSQRLKASRVFLERLAAYVYDIASKSVMADYQAPRLSGQPDVSTTNSPVLEANAASSPLLRTLPMPCFIIASDQTIRDVAHVACEFLGLKRSDIVGKLFYDVLRLSFSSSDTLESWMQYAAKKSVTATRSWDRVKIAINDDTTRQVDMAAHYSHDDPDGQELVLTIFDHTDKYTRDDEDASFVSMAVHELRTPLTAMRGYIEIFEDEITDKLDAEQKQFLNNLSAQAQQLGSFVSNIQNLSRIEENSLELQLKQEHWDEVLNSAVKDMEARARARQKRLSCTIPEGLPAVAVDRMTIYEVLINLIENAIKYTHTDSPIELTAYVKDENWVETTVTDKGVGIPDGLLGHVFDKFYRSHRSKRTVGGTGLGLYISKTIVEAHGGQIWVKTKEGEGSTFGFTVPTYESVAKEGSSSDNKSIERRAHGWIKNHTLYRR